MNEFFEQIKERRKSLKLRQSDIAEITGLSEKTIRNIEQGASKVSMANLMKVLSTLGLQLKLELNKEQE